MNMMILIGVVDKDELVMGWGWGSIEMSDSDSDADSSLLKCIIRSN